MGFTYRTITEALDFAPNVTKIILPVGKCLKGAVLDPTQFSVAAKRIFNKPKDFVWPKFMGEKPEDALKGKRAIESLYVSVLEGNPQDDGNCITLNMVCAPMDSLGSTLLYDGSFNRLVEVKHEIVQTKPITTDEGILSGLVFDQLGGDRLVYGEWLKFGTFEHPDATLGYAHYEPEHTENEKLPLVIWLHGAGEGGGGDLRYLQQQGAVIQGELMARPGGGDHSLRNGDAPFPQKDGAPLRHGNGLRKNTHPQFGPLQVDDEMGLLHPCGPGGGAVDLPQHGGVLGQGCVGQVEPGARHAGGKQAVQNGAVSAGGAQGSVKFHGNSSLGDAVFFIMPFKGGQVNQMGIVFSVLFLYHSRERSDTPCGSWP